MNHSKMCGVCHSFILEIIDQNCISTATDFVYVFLFLSINFLETNS